jgi:hypothetical protein
MIGRHEENRLPCALSADGSAVAPVGAIDRPEEKIAMVVDRVPSDRLRVSLRCIREQRDYTENETTEQMSMHFWIPDLHKECGPCDAGATLRST